MENSKTINKKIEIAKNLIRLPFIPIPNFQNTGTLFFIDNKFTIVVDLEENEVAEFLKEI